MNLSLTKLNILMPGIFVGIAAIMATIMTLTGKDKKISMKVFFVFSLVAFAVSAAFGLTSFIKVTNQVYLLIINQILFLILGIVYLSVFYKYNKWAKKANFIHEFIFTLCITFMCIAGFILSFSFFNTYEYLEIIAGSAIFFIVPLLVVSSFEFLLLIPALEYKKWRYPLGQEMEFPEEDSKYNYVIKIELTKSAGDNTIISDNAFAPHRWDFGVFFTYFTFDHNEKFPGSKISVRDEKGNPQAWYFYRKHKWYQKRRYLDAEKSVGENAIKEHDVIIAERV